MGILWLNGTFFFGTGNRQICLTGTGIATIGGGEVGANLKVLIVKLADLARISGGWGGNIFGGNGNGSGRRD